MIQIYDFLKDQNLCHYPFPWIHYAINLEKDGKITLVKGKPFTGVREGENPWRRVREHPGARGGASFHGGDGEGDAQEGLRKGDS